jgi:hypothetical protein
VEPLRYRLVRRRRRGQQLLHCHEPYSTS